MSDLENQLDEICVLQSIYTQEEFTCNDQRIGEFVAYINVPNGFYITYKNINEDKLMEVPISHLPPITLTFKLPEDYPSKNMPSYEISCMWLPVKKLNQLCKRLDELWSENSGTVILYTWTHFLKEESLEYLGIGQSLDLTKRYLSEIRRYRYRGNNNINDDSNKSIRTNVKDECSNREHIKSSASPTPPLSDSSPVTPLSSSLPLTTTTTTSKNHSNNHQDSGQYCQYNRISDSQVVDDDNSDKDLVIRKKRYDNSIQHHQQHRNRASPYSKMNVDHCSTLFQKDPRIVFQPISGVYTHQYIVDFSEERTFLQFQRNIYLCEICFQDKPGAKCVEFKPCNHVYCKECIKGYFETRIKDGVVQTMPCPYHKCQSEASQGQIKDVIGPVLYDKYDEFLLSSTLSMMEDITYCPRQSCGTPVMRDIEDNMAVCPSCRYVFCIFCKMTYHGVAPCRLKLEEKQKILEAYEQADSKEKFKLEKRYGKKQILSLIQLSKTESWISENSKPCPHCNSNIEKSDGCNKIACWQCGKYFCWLCLSILDPNAPYEHFWEANSKCKNRLYHGVNIPLEEQDLPIDIAAIIYNENGDPQFNDILQALFDRDELDEMDFDVEDLAPLLELHAGEAGNLAEQLHMLALRDIMQQGGDGGVGGGGVDNAAEEAVVVNVEERSAARDDLTVGVMPGGVGGQSTDDAGGVSGGGATDRTENLQYHKENTQPEIDVLLI